MPKHLLDHLAQQAVNTGAHVMVVEVQCLPAHYCNSSHMQACSPAFFGANAINQSSRVRNDRYALDVL